MCVFCDHFASFVFNWRSLQMMTRLIKKSCLIQMNHTQQVVPKVTKIRTQGLARYIGVSNLAFSADFGRPIQVITSAENIEWQQYRWEDKTYMLVGINKYSAKVCAIYL